jgi:CheY-like chemotaxis protein
MTAPIEQRQGGDRRRRPRGGRRPGDLQGYTPLVMVIDPDASRRDVSEAILAKLRFAVAPVESVEKGVSIAQALRPEVIVTTEANVEKIRMLLPRNEGIPIVALDDETRVTDALIEEVRRAIRDASPV